MEGRDTDSYTVLKSSIDKHVRDAALVIAAARGIAIPTAEVEDVTQAEAILKDAPVACLYQLVKFEESPRYPRYSAAFNVGVKSKDDSGNLLMTDLINQLKKVFAADRRLDLHDFSGMLAGPREGALMITSATAHAQAFDKQQGIRMISCYGMAIIHGS